MQPGDHLVVSRWGYDHHGLYAGNNQVIHYTGPFSSEGPVTGRIIVSSLEIFTGNGDCYLREYSHRYYSPSESLARAHQRLGERAYNLQFNNCEHFVTWCIQGRAESRQVSMAVTTLGSAALSVRVLPLLCPSRRPNPFLTAPVPSLRWLIETASSGQLAVTAAQVLGRVVRKAGRF